MIKRVVLLNVKLFYKLEKYFAVLFIFYLILILIEFNKLAFSQALSLGINNAKKKM